MLDLDHLSYSSISSYLLCGASWKYHYVDKVPTKANANLIFGSAFHTTVETFVKNNHTGDIAALWREAWTEQLEKEKVIDFDGASPEVEFNLGLRMLTNPDVLSGIKAIESDRIETKVELRVPGVPVPIIGYIDVITKDGVPGDFKTSARAWTQDKADDELQTLFYLAAMNQAGMLDVQQEWKFRHFIFVKTKTPQFQRIEHVHQVGETLWLFQLIREVWRGIEAGVFPINPTGWKCCPAYCDYYALCRGKYTK